MINLASPVFWSIALLMVLAVRVVGAPPRARPWLFIVATAVLMAASGAGGSWVALLVVAGLGYGALHLTTSATLVTLHATLMSAVFVGSQYAAPLTAGMSPAMQVFPLLGLPYVYLRWLHLLIEVWRGRLERPDPVGYLAYLLPFHQLIAGPIERYPSFKSQMDASLAPLTREETVRALDRLTTGLLKKLVVVHLMQRVFGFGFETHGLALLVEIWLYALYIYLEFSGYMDMMIGVGQLVGWRPPENFNWPYLRRNMIVFWEHWHISLSEWIRDYLFVPSNLYLQRGWLRGRPLAAGVVSYFVAMVLCGFWHRANLQFLLWGALHGVGIVACKVYGNELRRRLGKKRFKAYMASPVAGVIATFVTFNWVAFSFLFAFHEPSRAIEILGQLR